MRIKESGGEGYFLLGVSNRRVSVARRQGVTASSTFIRGRPEYLIAGSIKRRTRSSQSGFKLRCASVDGILL